MNSFLKKISIFLIVFLIVFNTPGIPKPINKAEAQTVVECPACSKLWKDIVDSIEKVGRWVKEDMMAALTDVVAKRIIDYIVDQTVVWIQGGGKPKFVTDWDGFLKDAFDIGFDEIIKQAGLAWLCKPFSFQLRLSLLPTPSFSKRVECTLDDVIANIEDFYDDFRNGSWIAYSQSYEPQNNFFGASLMTSIASYSEGEKQKEAARQEAQAGQGFLSVKKCIRTGRTDPNDPSTEKCLEYEIITPSSIVKKAVDQIITSDTEWAANIKSWLSVLINAVINRITKEGVGLLSMGKSDRAGDSYYPPEYQAPADLEEQRQKQQMIEEVQKFLNEWQHILNAKKNTLSANEQLVVALQEIKNRNCQPPVAENEIQTVQSEINSLKIQISDLETKITEANKLTKEIKEASTLRQKAIAQENYLTFMNKYNTLEIQEQIVTGSAREAADQEANNTINKLSLAQSRLNLCILTTTSTTP
jgi:hypothetical protein